MEDRIVEGTESGRTRASVFANRVTSDKLTRYESELSYIRHSWGDNRISSGTDPSHIASCSLMLCSCKVMAQKIIRDKKVAGYNAQLGFPLDRAPT